MGMGRPVFLMCLVATATVIPSCGDSSGSNRPRVSCTISTVQPATGDPEGGTALLIRGSGFENTPSLTVVIGANAVPVSWISETAILTTTPPDTRLPTGGPVDIRVVSANRVCTLESGFTYLANCTVMGDSPGGEPVIIFGVNFEDDPSLRVEFGGNSVPAVWLSNEVIQAVTPPDTRTPPAGPVDVTVVSPNRNCTLAGGYTYIYAPVGAASVEIDGNLITFDTADHFYDSGFGAAVIDMYDSTPPGWYMDIYVFGPDASPGCFDTCFDFVFVDVFNPSLDLFWESPCFYDVAGCYNQYSTTSGGISAGTFSGVVENISVPNDTLTLTNGVFTAERR